MNPLAPLLAAVDVGELIKFGVILLIFVVPAIRQLLVKMRQIQPPPGGPRPPPPVPRDVAGEIEEFMRRAAERRSAKAARPARPQQPAAPAAAPVRAEVVSDTERPVGGQVSEHVQKYLDEQEFRRRGDSLGQQVAQADQQIDQRLHQTFDHRVSKLEAVPGEAAAAPAVYEPPDLVGASADVPDSFATGLLELITNPDSLRQAVVLSEILNRPEERWG